jgi:lysophospholipase L1-like esterase
MRSLPRGLVGVLVAASLIALTGCAATPQSAPEAGSTSVTSAPSPTSTADSTLGTPENPVRVAIVGDSLTAGGGRTIPAMGLDQNTWMTYAQGNGVDWVGGWAMGGTTVQIMSQHVKRIPHVDVLVLMAGTNDVRLHYTFAEAAPYYESIVKTIDPKRVIIGAIPPYDPDPNAAAVYGRQLKEYALSKGWDYTDPWRFARDGKRYVAGISNDGIHPTTAGYRIVGHEYRDAILRVVSTPVAG